MSRHDPEGVECHKETPMAQTLVSLIAHVVFSTKNREPLITPEIEPELFAYVGGILKNNESRLLDAGGTADHVHLLISQSKNIALSFLMKDVKKDSSSWIKTKGREFRHFHWQDGEAIHRSTERTSCQTFLSGRAYSVPQGLWNRIR